MRALPLSCITFCVLAARPTGHRPNAIKQPTEKPCSTPQVNQARMDGVAVQSIIKLNAQNEPGVTDYKRWLCELYFNFS